MQLNAKERLTLPNLLPTNGTYHDLVAIRELGDMIRMSPEEEKEMGIVRQDGRIASIDEAKCKVEVGVDFTQEQIEMIAKELKEFEKKGHLNMDILGLFEKFVGAPKDTSGKS